MKKQVLELKKMIHCEAKKRALLIEELTKITTDHIKPEFYKFFLNAIIINQKYEDSTIYSQMLTTSVKSFNPIFAKYIQSQKALDKDNQAIIKLIKKQENDAFNNGVLNEYYKNLYNIKESIESNIPLEHLPWQPHKMLYGTNIPVFDTISKFLKNETPTIIEAGAFDGKDSCNMKKKWPNSTHYAFEPTNQYYDIAKSNTYHLDNYSLFKQALYSKEMQMSIHQPHGKMLSGSKIQSNHDKTGKKANEIEFFQLDTFVKRNNIKKIDLLFLDTEGTENHVLQGAKETLKIVDVIYIELNFFKREGWAHFNEINAILNNHNFKLQSIFDEGMQKTRNIKYHLLAQSNGIYTKQ